MEQQLQQQHQEALVVADGCPPTVNRHRSNVRSLFYSTEPVHKSSNDTAVDAPPPVDIASRPSSITAAARHHTWPANLWIASLRNPTANTTTAESDQKLKLKSHSQRESYSLISPWTGSRTTTTTTTPSSCSKLESIQQHQNASNRRLRQLAVQSSGRIRSLTARESTAAAEKWRYVQAVLDHRKRESQENRERFIRQPLERILMNNKSPSILKSYSNPDALSSYQWAAERWLTIRPASRVVRFEDESSPPETEDLLETSKLPPVSSSRLPLVRITDAGRIIPEETSSKKIPAAERLPPLISAADAGSNSSSLCWADRQVAKVRQRRLWASQIKHPSSSSVTWDVIIDKAKKPSENKVSNNDSLLTYPGWSHFPVKVASSIRNRQEQMTQTATSIDVNPSLSPGNPFQRRKKFARTLLSRLLAKDVQGSSIRAASSKVIKSVRKPSLSDTKDEIRGASSSSSGIRIIHQNQQHPTRIDKEHQDGGHRISILDNDSDHHRKIKGDQLSKKSIECNTTSRIDPSCTAEAAQRLAASTSLIIQVSTVSSEQQGTTTKPDSDDQKVDGQHDGSSSKMIKDVKNNFVILSSVKADDDDDEHHISIDNDAGQDLMEDNVCCVHQAVLGCLLPPEATEALTSLDQIRRQLKRTRLRAMNKNK